MCLCVYVLGCLCLWDNVQRRMQSHPCVSFSSLSLMMAISLSLASRAVEKPDDHRGTFTFTGAEMRPDRDRGKHTGTVKTTWEKFCLLNQTKRGIGGFCNSVLQNDKVQGSFIYHSTTQGCKTKWLAYCFFFFLNGMSCGVYVYVYIVCLCVSTVPVLSAELHDFLVKFRLLLCSHIQEKAQHQLCPKMLKGRVHTLWIATAHTHRSNIERMNT